VFYSAKKDLSMTLNSFFIIVAKVKQGFSLSSFPGNNFFVSQSFLHQQITNEYFTFLISLFCGCKVDITMNLLYLSIFDN